ncbi:MAG: DNA internalization-related competence protein ComEC/Rec2 [Rhodocyclaceae bacterium]
MRLNILAFAAGVFLLQVQQELPGVWLQLSIFLAGLAVAVPLARRPHFALRILVAIACLGIGFGWAALRAEWRLADALAPEWEGWDVEVIGVIAELPQAFSRGQRFSFDVEQVLTPEAVVPSRVMVSWYRGEHDGDPSAAIEALAALGAGTVHAGERWRLTLRLKRPHGNANPHGFDYEAWLLERGIRATGYVRPKGENKRLDDLALQPLYLIERLRESIRSRFLAALPESEHAGILVALTVGDQRAIEGDYWKVFARTGTTHLMSISGLHVTMVAALLGGLAGMLWRRSPRLMLLFPAQRAAVFVGALAALLYALLAGFSVPAQRTALMLAVAALALLSGRRTAASRTLTLALAAVLLLDPWAVLAPGFWLSFGAVSLLFYVASEKVVELAGWRASVSRWSAAQWAVSVGTLPLLLLFFQQFSLVSPLANALAIPAISFIVTPLALLAAFLPVPGLLLLDHWLLGWVMQGLTWLAEFPVYTQPAPPLWCVVLALSGIGWMLLPRGFPARWLGLLLLLPAVWVTPARPPSGQAWMTVLDVGQGLAVVVQTATKTLLYDTGPLYSAESDAGQRVILPYLRALGVEALDAMVITHSDSDHSGGAASVLTAMPVARVISSVPDIAAEPCVAGQRWEWEGVRFSMLHPSGEAAGPKARAKPNNLSCVLRVEASGTSMLLTSDIEAVDELALLARDATVLRSDVLLVPHHGSRTSSTPAFIAAVAARQVIYPVGYRNRFGHPRADVVARYGDTPSWRSDRHGALTVRLADGASVSSYRETHRRYWYGR